MLTLDAAPQSWRDRLAQHDDIGLPLFDRAAAAFGVQSEPWGQESGNRELVRMWRILPDRFSVLNRWRPDRFLLNEYGCWPAEIKTESGHSPNHAMEAASFLAGLLWARTGVRLLYAFVDLCDGSIRCCWHSDLPRQQTILAPPHARRDEIGLWLARDWPGATYKHMERKTRGGSNTAFFLVPKNSIFLKPLDQFFGERFRTTD